MSGYTTDEEASLPRIANLHQRHPGLTEAICGSFDEAASVCLSRHHSPPTTLQVFNEQDSTFLQVDWIPPGDRTRRAWNNVDDTTEAGAYGMSIAALETQLGLFVIERAETRTGSDWYISHRDTVYDLEAAYRLEVSGIDHGSEGDLNRRLREKIEQTRRGKSNLPAIASVVGFLIRIIKVQKVDED